LALRPGRILTHSWLLREVWGRETPDLLHYVRIAVAGLRKKLEPTPGATQFLHTEVGVGYRFFERGDTT
ncbi:MAG TPA: helix-turn-helix domain-containing protein, partial [Spirochaetia bacterium]|nr:helix-turn-helix domain-containing protein [Spirochaetia bacterium]